MDRQRVEFTVKLLKPYAVFQVSEKSFLQGLSRSYLKAKN